MTSTVRVSCSLYKMLLFTYPRDFRLRFESEMVANFLIWSAASGNIKGWPESRKCGGPH